jgi:hypothetical protein
MKTLEEIEMCTYFRGVISDKLKTNWLTITIFIIFGLLLAFLEFDFDKESYNTLFSTMATIILALVGFIGIFFVLLLETNRDSILDYVADVYRLKKEKVKIFDYIPITKSSTIKNIDNILNNIQHHIDVLNQEIEGPTNKDHFVEFDNLRSIEATKEISEREKERVEERNTLIEIKSILENLKEERKKLGKYLNCFKDTFLFAIFSILLFMIPIALNHINFSNDNYSTVFKYRSFFKMFFTGFLFGLFFIILKDSAFILKKTFDKLDFFKLNQDGG